MATLADDRRLTLGGDDRFFLISAFVMTAVIIAGFSLQLVMGRSSFSSPPLVHAHAIVFMGWVAIYLAQNVLATSGNIALHRRLGWLAAAWVVPMVVLGCAVTLAIVRRGQVPFFFQPVQFLVFDPMTVFTFAGLVAAAISLRRRTDWHRRLQFCGMALLLGPAFGRISPMPLLKPWAFEWTFIVLMMFPIAGAIADWRRTRRVHPAWGWGIGTIVASVIVIEVVSYGPAGSALYAAVTEGTPGAAVPPLEFAAPPPDGRITGRG